MEIANGTVYGLGAHVQGQDLAAARAVAARIRSGQVHINNPPWSPDAPFGGYKRSGNGREYGVEGLEEYLETKAILGYGNWPVRFAMNNDHSKGTSTMTAALLLHRADGALPSTAFRQAAFGPADPFARDREIAWEGPGAMSVGRVSFIGEVDVAHYPHTETIVVVEGELSLVAAGAAPLVLRRGEGAVIARGTALRIQAASRASSCSVQPRPSWRTSPASRRCARTRTSNRPGRCLPRCCWARPRSAAATTSSRTS